MALLNKKPIDEYSEESTNEIKAENSTIKEKSLRFNEGKPKWHLVDLKSLEPLVRVLENGAIKYGEFNWQKYTEKDVILDSCMRHQVALNSGQELDDESGLPHMAHIAANAMFYLYHMKNTWNK